MVECSFSNRIGHWIHYNIISPFAQAFLKEKRYLLCKLFLTGLFFTVRYDKTRGRGRIKGQSVGTKPKYKKEPLVLSKKQPKRFFWVRAMNFNEASFFDKDLFSEPYSRQDLP